MMILLPLFGKADVSRYFGAQEGQGSVKSSNVMGLLSVTYRDWLKSGFFV